MLAMSHCPQPLSQNGLFSAGFWWAWLNCSFSRTYCIITSKKDFFVTVWNKIKQMKNNRIIKTTSEIRFSSVLNNNLKSRFGARKYSKCIETKAQSLDFRLLDIHGN